MLNNSKQAVTGTNGFVSGLPYLVIEYNDGSKESIILGNTFGYTGRVGGESAIYNYNNSCDNCISQQYISEHRSYTKIPNSKKILHQSPSILETACAPHT